MRYFTYSFIVIVVVLSCSANAASDCERYKKKYHKIQIKQKEGHSAKKSATLNKQERKAWQRWMDCKKGKLKK